MLLQAFRVNGFYNTIKEISRMNSRDTITHGLNTLDGKDKLKDLITKDVNLLTDSIEIVKNSTDDILQELINSIGIIDFQILAFPESENLQKEYAKLKNELFGESPIYTDSQSSEYKEVFKQWQKVSKELSKCKLTKDHYLILCIEQLLKIAIANKWGLCKKNGFIYSTPKVDQCILCRCSIVALCFVRPVFL